MFTHESNFTYGKTRIADTKSDSLDENIDLIIHIQKYEKECLLLLLGPELYDEFIQKVEIVSGSKHYTLKTQFVDTKWDWLLNGKTYPAVNLNCGCGCQTTLTTKQWRGLTVKVAVIDNKNVIETLMAKYIFFHWSLNYRTLNVGTGEGRIESKGVTTANAILKRVDIWNDFVQWASYGFSCSNVSLYQFLEDFKNEFINTDSTCLKTENYYDI